MPWQWAWTWQPTGTGHWGTLGKCTSGTGSFKLPSALGRLPDATGITAVLRGLWAAKYCSSIILLRLFFSSSSLVILASFVGKGENNLSQPQGLGSKQPGNTGRGKEKPYTLAPQVRSQHKYLPVSFVLGGFFSQTAAFPALFIVFKQLSWRTAWMVCLALQALRLLWLTWGIH